MGDASSALWQKANEIYVKKGLAKDTDGQYIAAVLASREIEKTTPKKEEVSDEVLQKRLDKEVGKKSLATVSKKVVTSTEDVLAKLEKGKFAIELTSMDSWQTAKAIGKFKKGRDNDTGDDKDSDDKKFEVIDPTKMKFAHCCPRCGYEWGDPDKKEKESKNPDFKERTVVGKHKPKKSTR